MKFDAVLLIAAGGPERPTEVVPFLQQLQASRALREDQVAAIGEEYEAIGRRSPLNEWTRRQAAALAIELRHRGHALRISCGMRDWHPLIQDSLESLHDSGRGTVLAWYSPHRTAEAGARPAWMPSRQRRPSSANELRRSSLRSRGKVDPVFPARSQIESALPRGR